jgi:hypothetical protein
MPSAGRAVYTVYILHWLIDQLPDGHHYFTLFGKGHNKNNCCTLEFNNARSSGALSGYSYHQELVSSGVCVFV